MEITVFSVLWGVLGVFFGSFLTFLIPRMAENKPLALFGHSKAHFSGRSLRWYEIIPLFSYFFATCWHFFKKNTSQQENFEIIPVFYPLTELFCGVLFYALAIIHGITPFLGLFSLIGLFWASLMLYDGFYGLIDRRITIFFGIFLIFFQFFTHFSNFWTFLAAGALGGAWFWLQWLFSRGKWVGQGDIDLGILFGLTVGLERLWFWGMAVYYAATVWIILMKLAKKPLKRVHMAVFVGLLAVLSLLFEDFSFFTDIFW